MITAQELPFGTAGQSKKSYRLLRLSELGSMMSHMIAAYDVQTSSLCDQLIRIQ